MLPNRFTDRQIIVFEIVIALLFCFAPLFFNNPYRINIFLSWEGAYRLSIGQVPFRDFALPMGYGYWVIPALFFKLFGPYMHSLIKAQVFINLVSLYIFHSIFRLLGVRTIHIFLAVVVFCFSYVSWNFWPWYNHVVIVFQMIAVYFILLSLFPDKRWKEWLFIALSAFFVFFAIWTKQDAGGLVFFIVYGILIYDAWIERSMKKSLGFTAFFILFAAVFIAPVYQYDFSYWFNYGQPPHRSRLELINFMNEILGWAYWEKFFLFIMTLFILDNARSGKTFFYDKKAFLFAFVCFAFVAQALIIQVTSHEPPNGEAFFYAFGFLYILAHLKLNLDLQRWYYLAPSLVLIFFWWTGIYWRNMKRFVASKPVVVEKMEETSKHKYRLAKEYKTMEKLYLSESTLEGIRKIKELPVFKTNKDPKVLNMSELTSLAYEIPFTPLTNQPMWFHQTVSIWQKEVDEFCTKIQQQEYDVVLFESIPYSEVVNFYPMDVKACLDQHYQHEFRFLAPRTPEHSFIDVYTRKSP